MKEVFPRRLSDPAHGTRATDAELCDYIAELCLELRGLASRPSFRMVRYLLDMARLEVERMARESRNRAAR